MVNKVFAVYNCVVNDHDLRLVVLAALICALASLTAITLVHHVRKSFGYIRYVWLGVSAIATGFGIWATHFIAMLAFSSGVPSGYNVSLTAASLVVAILTTGAGFAVALSTAIPGTRLIGGFIVGGGIAVMHFTGMSAFEIAGRIVWNLEYVVASIALGELFGAIALSVGLRGNQIKSRIFGAVLLTLGICLLHFTAMAAVSIVADPSIDVPNSALAPSWLAVAVALASFTIIMLALAGLGLDVRDRRRTELEGDRLRGLANAAVEGLIVCHDDVIVTVNNSFATLAGADVAYIVGASLERFIPDEEIRARLFASPNIAIEAELRQNEGKSIPIELIHRPIDFSGRPHHAIAVRDLRSRKQAERHIHFLAHNDALTGLPNRSTFNKKLDQEIEKASTNGTFVAVLCLDLDRFKEVNDLFGHAAGDTLLQSVAKCVTTVLKQDQMMARLGGDEFAVIAPGIASPSAAGRIAERILEALVEENANPAAPALMSTSIGVAIYPNDALDRQALLNHADTALYRAKLEGRGTYRFFEMSMGAQVRDRRLLEHDLRHAISRRELSLVYQPQKDIKSDTIVGFEALLRWKHPERGDIPPSLFVPVAEESGIILQIGDWVLRMACQEAAKWKGNLTVAVNVSPVQLHTANFAATVHEILLQTGLPPRRLELEITETALIRDFHRALTTLRQLKALGIRIAMDDFGTGYSSLSNLQAFPFDKIKIDGSFIKSVDENGQAAAIVRAVLGLGRGLNLPVLAEGVETIPELEFLARECCDEVQGFLLGRPGDIAQFRDITRADVDAGDMPIALPADANDRRLRVVG
jgi:diguanylate cyclase (GGDEF)-like protein/PAS domain S-box-containing protein